MSLRVVGIKVPYVDNKARIPAQSSDLLLAGPAERQAVVLFLAFFLRLDDSVLLKLDETLLRVPRSEAAKPDNTHVE